MAGQQQAHLDAARRKFDADGGVRFLVKYVTRVAGQQAGLADAAVSQQNHLEEMVVAAEKMAKASMSMCQMNTVPLTEFCLVASRPCMRVRVTAGAADSSDAT